MARIAINVKEGKVEKDLNVIIGIDLGTTNSLVAFIEAGEAKAVKDENGKHTLMPSILHFNNEGKITVGDRAKEKLITEPENTIYSVKRLLGKNFEDLQSHQQYFGYEIMQDEYNEDALVKIKVNNRYFSPIELSAEILKALKSRIEKQLNGKVSKAVITVPAYFNDTQRQATRDAGKLAGLEVLRIVNEPTAASLAYGLGINPEENKKIAVYDLGGGTFDISILEIQDGIFEVLSTNGDTFLGGDDFDRAIMDFWMQQHHLKPEQLESDKKLSQIIRIAAEDAKKHLSFKDQFEVQIEDFQFQLSKSELETLLTPLIERTIKHCQNAMKDAQLKIEDIDEIVMVGGSTRVPLVNSMVGNFFNKKVNNDLNPDEVVALGAAIQADVLAGNQKNILLLDVTPLSLGIETVGGLMDNIIPRNSKIPTNFARNYTTSVDGQKNLKVAVYQGERDLVKDNRKIGEFILKGIPPMPAGIPKIEIQFLLNADGILKVKASELRSGVEQSIEIKSTYGISEEEMGKMLMDSIKHAAGDMAQRGLLEARNEANNMLMAARKFLEQHKDIITKEELTTTRTLIDDLQKAVNGEDKDKINKDMEVLNAYTTPMAHRAMDKTILENMQGKKIV